MRNMAIGLLATFLFNLAFSGILLAALPLYLSSKNVSVVEMGLIFSFFPLVFQLLRVVFGGLSDVFGNKLFLFSSGVMQAVTALVYFFAPSHLYFALGKVGEGVATSALRGVERPLIFAGSERYGVGKIAGYYSAAIWLGMGLGAAIAGYLIVHTGFDLIFLLTATIGLVIAVASFFLREQAQRIRGGVVAHFLELRHVSSRVKKMLLFLSLDGFAMGSVWSFAMVLFLKDFFSLPPDGVGLVFLIVLPAHGLTSILLGRLSDIYDNKKLFFASNGLFALAFFGVALLVLLKASLVFVVACLVLMRFSDAVSGTTVNRIATLCATPKKLGRDLNFIFTGYWFGYWIGTLTAGAIIASFGYASLFALAGVAELALALLMLKKF